MPDSSSKWNINLNTLVMLGGIGGVLIAWGYTLSGLQRDTDRNTQNVAQLIVRLEQNDSVTAQHELRLKQVEKIADDANALRRELNGHMVAVESDIAVMKEIITRMEKERKP